MYNLNININSYLQHVFNAHYLAYKKIKLMWKIIFCLYCCQPQCLSVCHKWTCFKVKALQRFPLWIHLFVLTFICFYIQSGSNRALIVIARPEDAFLHIRRVLTFSLVHNLTCIEGNAGNKPAAPPGSSGHAASENNRQQTVLNNRSQIAIDGLGTSTLDNMLIPIHILWGCVNRLPVWTGP